MFIREEKARADGSALGVVEQKLRFEWTESDSLSRGMGIHFLTN